MHLATMRLWITSLVALCLISATLAAEETATSKSTVPIPPFFTNRKALRQVDLRSGVVREEIAIRALNIAGQPVKEYYYAVPAAVEKHVAYFTAFAWDTKESLVVENGGYDSAKKQHIYKVILNPPAQPDEDVKLGFKLTYTHVLTPLPKKIDQLARQHLLYKGNGYFYSPYESTGVKTTFQLPNNNIISHSGDNAQKSGNKIVYGPYTSLKPYSIHMVSCHFEGAEVLLAVKHLRRDVELSHWAGNLAVEEHYDLSNVGAELAEPFNRAVYMRTGHSHHLMNVLKELHLALPPSARDVYFRDEIGNVSTSHFRNEKDTSVLEISPRYPLFGGWNYSWNHGYNADLSSFVRRAKDGKYILSINLVDNVQKMVVEDIQARIILPEGATNVQVHTPVDINVEHKTHYTYFDSTGRHMVILQKHNVVQEHAVPVQIVYEYSTLQLFQKPMVASLATFSLFVVSMIVARLTFTIGSKKSKVE